MKTIILVLSLSFVSIVSFSKSVFKNQFDLSGYIFINNVFRFTEIEGSGYTDNGEGIRLGLNYNRRVINRLWITSGINYLHISNIYHSPFSGQPDPQIIKNQKSQIIQVPIRIRYNILRWLYFKTGLTFDYQFNNRDGMYIDNQSGIGFSLLSGINLKISEQIIINIEPEFGISSLIPFNSDKYQQHLIMAGVNINMGYKF